jgi:hypothetical protein
MQKVNQMHKRKITNMDKAEMQKWNNAIKIVKEEQQAKKILEHTNTLIAKDRQLKDAVFNAVHTEAVAQAWSNWAQSLPKSPSLSRPQRPVSQRTIEQHFMYLY